MRDRRVFLDITIDNTPAGRIIIELYEEHAPKACLKSVPPPQITIPT